MGIGHIGIILIIISVSLIPVFAQGMGLYENTLYDFSFEAPTDWKYQESVTLEGLTFPVVLYPNEFSLENADDANFLDLQTAMMGLGFQIESPLLSVEFHNIPKSELPNLNDNSVKDYVEERIRIISPDIKIYSASVEGRSWGWIVKYETAQSIDLGIGQGLPYQAIDTHYVFKDREMYAVGYGTIPRYFDSYLDVYEHALDTLVIKDIEVSKPESFLEILPTGTSEGGCLIATATYGSELAPQVQQLRELRDNTLLQTQSGSAFMSGFNEFYYSFSPSIADYERENPIFKEAVKLTITPLLTSLSILNYVDMDSEEKVLGYGISLILINIGMYFVAPALLVFGIYKKHNQGIK